MDSYMYALRIRSLLCSRAANTCVLRPCKPCSVAGAQYLYLTERLRPRLLAHLTHFARLQQPFSTCLFTGAISFSDTRLVSIDFLLI